MRIYNVFDLIQKYGSDLRRIPLKLFEGLDFSGQDISDCILPTYTELFQVIEDKNLYEVTLPSNTDYSLYNFNGVNIESTWFPEICTIPANKDFFQKIKMRSLAYTKLPLTDYKNYDFSDVIFYKTYIPADAIMPDNFLQVIDNTSCNFTIPQGLEKSIHLREINAANINLRESSKISKYKKLILAGKNKIKI